QFNNPVANVNVTFTVTGGGGTITPASPATVATNTSGVAALTSWRVGTTAGGNTLTAVSTGLTGSPLTFTATGTAGAATQLAIQAGNGQSATVNTTVATNPSVVVRDQFNNPVANVNVTFTVTGGGGTITPASPATIATNTSGVAALTSWRLGTTAGSNTLSAASTGLAGSPVTFTATGTAGAATQLAFTVQPTDVGADQPVTPALEVTVRDAFGNNVTSSTADITLTIVDPSGTPGAILSGGGPVSAVGGVAIFSALSIDLVGLNYQLRAAANGLTAAVSSQFNVTVFP
ncbi:MAG TPA: hypothetical protein VKD28_02350, partial [Gemmatimonadales bacterium]|nr:hypothetical protein [Gemmatimonadales bacterium]